MRLGEQELLWTFYEGETCAWFEALGRDRAGIWPWGLWFQARGSPHPLSVPPLKHHTAGGPVAPPWLKQHLGSALQELGASGLSFIICLPVLRLSPLAFLGATVRVTRDGSDEASSAVVIPHSGPNSCHHHNHSYHHLAQTVLSPSQDKSTQPEALSSALVLMSLLLRPAFLSDSIENPSFQPEGVFEMITWVS